MQFFVINLRDSKRKICIGYDCGVNFR